MKNLTLFIALFLNICFFANTAKANNDEAKKLKEAVQSEYGVDGKFKYISNKKKNKITIYNVNDEKVKEYTLNDYIIPVDLRNFPDGVYFVKVNSRLWTVAK